MPTIGILEGFAPSRMRMRPPIILGNDFDLVFLGFDPSYDMPRTQNESFAVAAFTNDRIAYLLKTINPETGKNYTYAEANAAEKYARSMRSQAVAMREAGKLRERDQYMRQTATVKPLPIDDAPHNNPGGTYPTGDRGGSGSVPTNESFSNNSFQPDPPPTGIDTRGGSTAAFESAPGAASASGAGGGLLPLAAIAAAYFFMKG